MFFTRLRSSIILMLVALGTIISGGYILFGTVLALSFIGLGEIYRAMDIQTEKISALAAAGYLCTILYYVWILFGIEAYTMEISILFLVIFMMVYVFTFPRFKAEQVMAAFFSLIYVTFMLSYIYKTRMLPDGAYLVWLIFLCSWGCDTSAYCVGMLIGKHKMAPKLSPKKSVEGAVGGIVGAALLGAIYAAVVNKNLMFSGNTVIICAVICAVGAVISQIGDLAASAIKRNKDIKDYGTLIPGHGGILDRFDSVIFTAPIIYFMITLLFKVKVLG